MRWSAALVALCFLLSRECSQVSGATHDAVVTVSESVLNTTVSSGERVALAVVANWCGRCRQLDPNLKWAAEKLKDEGLHGVNFYRLDLSNVEDGLAESIKARFEVSELPTLLWVTQEGHHHFDGSLTANGIHQWARRKLAAEDIGVGLAACDACRASLEAMHTDWGPLVGRLVEAGSVVTGQTARLSDNGPAHLDAILQICASKAMRSLSGEVQEECRKQLRWHGHDIVSRHFGLFASWCGRSGDKSKEMSTKDLSDCADQWSSKVPNGRLGLHEKIMGICGREELSGVVRVCEFQRTGWKEAVREGRERKVGACEACNRTVADVLFILRTSKLGALPGATLRAKRRLDVEEALETVCVDAFNRHEGDATEGPAKRIGALCGEMMDAHGEEVVERVLASVGEDGARTVDVPALQSAVCRGVVKACKKSKV